MKQTTWRPAEASGVFTIGGDLNVYRLGFGAMHLTGKGIWGPPENKQDVIGATIKLTQEEFDTLDRVSSP